MSITRPSFRFVKFMLTLLLILSFLLYTIASDPVAEESIDLDNDSENDDDDLEGFEELLAIDEAEEGEASAVQDQEGSKTKPSEADVVSKAQRIVTELSSDNTKRIIDQNEYVLVLGYAPWCARSAEMMPQFAEAATVLKELGSPLLLAKLDAERYPKAASFLGIKGFPTLLLFVNGSSQAYSGGFSAEELVIWARKKTGAPVVRLSSIAEAEKFITKNRIFVIGLFEKYEGTDYEEFRKAAVGDNEIQFAETQNIEVAKFLFPDLKKQNPFLGIVKSEPEKYTTFDEAFEKDKILKFLDYNKFPLVTVLTELNSIRVYSSPVKLQVFVFAEVNAFKSMLSTLQNIAAKFKSKLMFIYVDVTEDNLAKPFLTLLGLEDSDGTVVAAFDNKVSSKYLLESDPTQSNLEEFCSGLLQGTVLPYFKSQPIPDNNLQNGTSVQTVVGRSFDELVLNSPHNVLLEVHTPWCIRCEATTKQVEKLAKHFKGMDNLVFARIDASANEHPKLQVEDFPSLLFFPANDKLNPIKLSTKSSLKELASVIKKNVRVAAGDRAIQDHQTNRDEL